MAAQAHAELGASSSARWIACPGSVPLSRSYTDRGSFYAAEGTVAHALCEKALAGEEITPVGEVVEHDGHEVMITRAMHDAVETYVNAILPVFAASKWHATEQQVTIQSAPPNAEVFGTADAVAVGGSTLTVGDFKYGKGVKVDPEDNTQLLFYALAVWETLLAVNPTILAGIRDVRLLVCQPRVDGPALRDWTISVVDLLMWREDVLLPAIQRIVVFEDKTLQDGKHCTFCPALAACPLKWSKAQIAAKMAFSDDWEDAALGSNSGTLSAAQIAERLTLVRSLATYIKALETETLQLMRMGDEIPGFKLVAGRSFRKWTGTDQEVLHALIKRLHPDDDLLTDLMVEPAVKSPAQIETVLKQRKLKPADVLDGLVFKPPGKPTLVADADPRPALPISTASEAFDDWTENDLDDL